MDSDALYFAALLAAKNPKNLRMVVREHLALTWQPVHDFCLTFLQAQGRLPKAVTVTRKFGIELPEVEEDVSYYAAAIRENAMRLALEDGLEEHVVGKLASAEPNAALDGAKRVVADVSRVFREGDRGLVLLDQRDNVDARRRDYKLRKRGNGKNGLPLPWDTLTRATGGLQPGDAWAILARPNIGKAQPLDAKVLTPTRWAAMGDLKVGDALASADGEPSEVTGVFDRGMRSVFRITFSDGRSTEACAEHLWRVHHRKWPEPRTLQTSEVAALLQRPGSRRRYWIDAVSGDFGTMQPLLVDPWLLGMLLGNGSMCGSSLRLSTPFPSVVARAQQALPAGMSVKYVAGVDYGLTGAGNPLMRHLRALGLWDHEAHEKFIPKSYMHAPRAVRVATLCGLMDADGWVEKDGAVMFCSASERLARDVTYLVRSLGGIATIRERKQPTYTYKGEKRLGRPAFAVGVSLPDAREVFSVPKKLCRVVARQKTRRITFLSIEPSRTTQTRCIAVSHPSHLYVTDDFIATHNTTALMVTATYLWRLGFRVLFVSQETPPQSALPKNPNHRVLSGTCIRCYTADVPADQPCPAAKVPRQRLTVRMDALAANVSMWRLLKGRLTPQEEERFFAYLEACRDPEAQGWGQIRLVSTPAVRTVMDLEMEIIEYQPDVVLWDSAYLAAVGPRKNDAAGNLVIDFKLMLERCGVPGIVSWHFNRDVDEKATEASQNSAALTDELGRVFDVLVGMFRPPEAVDAGEAIWRTLKVRDGIPMRELRTHFRVKEEINFAEIASVPAAPAARR